MKSVVVKGWGLNPGVGAVCILQGGPRIIEPGVGVCGVQGVWYFGPRIKKAGEETTVGFSIVGLGWGVMELEMKCFGQAGGPGGKRTGFGSPRCLSQVSFL